MDFKKILGDRSSYLIPVSNMVSLLNNEIRYKNSSCPVNEEIYLHALNGNVFKNIDSKVTIRENGIFFDIGIFNISLGAGNDVISVINRLIKYYENLIDPKNGNTESYNKYTRNRLVIINEIKHIIEAMYENDNRTEKIDENKVDEKKLKLYIAYHDYEDAKNSDFNSDKFLKSISRLNHFIKNNDELIKSKASFYFFDCEKEEMINFRTVDLINYVNECIKKNDSKDFTEEDIKNKRDLLEAYLVMEDLKVLDKSADYYNDYINILGDYLKNNIELLMQDYNFFVIDNKTGEATEYRISEILHFIQRLNNKDKRLSFTR